MSSNPSTGATGKLSIRLLGGFQVSIGSRIIDEAAWHLRKAQNLVKLLALAPRHRLHREQLMDLLWPDLELEAATNNLHKALHCARHAFEPTRQHSSSYLHWHGAFLLLDPPGPLWIDVEAFQAAADAARLTHDPADYEEALRLYSGDLLPEDRNEEWVVRPREELRAVQCALLTRLAELREQHGDIDGAIEALRQVVVSDPAYEEAHAGLMRLLVRAGHRHLALRQYQHLCDALSRELDALPAPYIQELHRQILDGASSVATHPAHRVIFPASFARDLEREG